MNQEELRKTLLKIDEEVLLTIGYLKEKPKVIIVGGSAFIINQITSRKTTHDIDVYEVDRCIRDIISKYPNVNSSVSAYLDTIPYNFEDRLISLNIGARAVNYCTPSLEDLVVMKLYAYRSNDIIDLEGAVYSEKLDWELLDYLIYNKDEAKASIGSERRYWEMVSCYEHFKERVRL